ncbi:hypothetical protein [Chitinophaga tropicalis]|uniref:Uncharacterized protein n=1 Tax=Chitinophaga tropicalis TaxID=2683588 RepID=A0A7K1U395_9BACT|nr:hypothetical protein [Chitinophaga tropicalis]MVT08475.1 hypothetical protein [Chitinophaga tropicalis]
MQTNAPLSPEDQQLLKLLFKKSRLEAITPLVIGLILIIPSLFPIIIFPADFWIGKLFFALLVCGGGYAIYFWKIKSNRLKEQENNVLSGQKYLISGILQTVQLIDYKFLRYQVGSNIADAYIPLHTSLSSSPIHKRVIKQAEAWTGQYVTLHLVNLEPGMDLLLQANYNKTFNETIVPLEETDKQKQYRQLRNTWLAAFGILAVLLLLMYFLIGMENEGLVVLGVIPILLFSILLWYSIPLIREIRNSSLKSVVITTITEIVTAVVRSGKSSSEYKWYRLGNGTLLQQSNVLLHIGQTVVIESIIKPDGEKGMLMDVRKV